MNKKEFKELNREQMIIAFNQLKDDYSVLFDELEQEKEKNEKLTFLVNCYTNEYFIEESKVEKDYISKDKIRNDLKICQEVFEKKMKPYQTEYGLNVTYLSKKEKEELINKRNCLLTQIKTYEMLLEEK